MKFINHTKWRTDHLRAFVKPLAMKLLEPRERKQLEVRFFQTRKITKCSWSYAHEISITLYLPPFIRDDRELLGWMAEKTLAKLARRSTAPLVIPDNVDGQYPWCWYLPLDEQPPQVKAKADKLAAAEKNLAAWEAKAKRAATWIRKYKRRIAALKRKRAASK